MDDGTRFDTDRAAAAAIGYANGVLDWQGLEGELLAAGQAVGLEVLIVLDALGVG